MNRTLSALCLSLVVAMIPSAVGEDERSPDKTIEIVHRDGRILLVEKGKETARPVTLVVGQTVRWENRDARGHRLVSNLAIEGKPLFDTGEIAPQGHKDVLLDIEVYRRAGGRPANVITLKYHDADRPEAAGELQLLSAARR